MNQIKRAPRVPFEEEVRYSAGSRAFRQRAVNISLSGIFIQTSDLQAVDAELDMEFDLPVGGARYPLRVRGKVYRTVPPHASGAMLPGMGITFIGLDARSRGLLSELIRERMPGSRWSSEEFPIRPPRVGPDGRAVLPFSDATPRWERRLPVILVVILVGMLAYVLWFVLRTVPPSSTELGTRSAQGERRERP
jgi:uncharacterized protein (TIGR02266 family)